MNFKMRFYDWIVALSVVGLWAAVNEVYSLRQDIKHVRQKTCNVDKARMQFLQEIEYQFKSGCRFGIDYPPEFRQEQTSFNQNSPVIFCHEQYLKVLPAVEQQLGDIGQ